mgnify:CR=1 FL=1
MIEGKICSKCLLYKTIDQFAKHKGRSDGLREECKQCTKQYHQQNPVIIQTGKMIHHARKRAIAKNLPFNINAEYLRSIVPSYCPIFGTKLEWSIRRGDAGHALPNSPSLDRIDPSKGYVKGNVWIISHRANGIKNDASHEELKLVTKAVGEALVNSLDF